ncbi:MAG: YggS family pyridoxal phosphate-dependent enzyme [Chloroflexota bacterium]|nr:YggS family pyridoxal phosphate-dependent enzyme [Chloroflexota bacterium]
MLRANWNIAEKLKGLRDSIAEAALRAGRHPDDITLVGISKTQPAEAVVEAISAGLMHFGENRVQEAAAKIPLVKQARHAEPVLFHMVGHLQSNKAGSAIGLFDSIDSVDSLHLAQALSRRAQLDGRGEVPVRLEVYVGDDPRRPGLRPDRLIDVAGQILGLPGLRVEGLMTVAPLGGDARAAFAQVRGLKLELAETFPRVHFGVLSMGMSEDFGLAIQEGSTEIRIGTALFGPRGN